MNYRAAHTNMDGHCCHCLEDAPQPSAILLVLRLELTRNYDASRDRYGLTRITAVIPRFTVCFMRLSCANINTIAHIVPAIQ